MTEPARYPLRTIRKEKTRAKLVAASQELFLTRGYKETTLEDVADAAGLHVQTLYRHFASKEELANAGNRAWLKLFRSRLENPERKGDTFDFWRAWTERLVERVLEKGTESERQNLQARHSSPLLLGHLWTVQTQYEDLLTASLARDFGIEDASPTALPRLVAAMLIGANAHVFRSFERGEGDLRVEALAVIDKIRSLFAEQLLAAGRETSVRTPR